MFLERELHPLVAVPRLDPRGDVLHVFGRVGIGWDLDVLAVELAVTDRDGSPECVELRTGVLDVVLALDRRARELEDRRERVTERPAAGVGDGERSGRIRGHELDLHALAGERLRAAELLVRPDDLVDLAREPFEVKAYVDEAIECLDRGDRAAHLHALADGLGDVARRLAHGPGQTERDARCVVPMVGILGPLDLDRLAIDAAPAELAGGAAERILQRATDLIAQQYVAHTGESGAATAGRKTSPEGS